MIRLVCLCGKTLTLPDDVAGQKVRCKAKGCGKVMKVRAGQGKGTAPARANAPGDSLGIKGHRRCGGCGVSYPATDRFCVTCGVDLETGAALYVSVDTDERQPPATARTPIPPTEIPGTSDGAPPAPAKGKRAAPAAPAARKTRKTGIPTKIARALKKRLGGQ